MKAKFTYRVIPDLPSNLEVLRKLAYNLCFSWKYDIQAIFQRIDPRLWVECNQNPVLMLGLVSQERLEELSKDQGFLAQLERVSDEFEEYLAQGRLNKESFTGEDLLVVAAERRTEAVIVVVPTASEWERRAAEDLALRVWHCHMPSHIFRGPWYPCRGSP